MSVANRLAIAHSCGAGWVAPVQRVGGLADQGAGRGQLGGHVREAELQCLRVQQPGPEGLPVGQIRQTAVQCALRTAQRAGGDAEPAAVESVHGDAEAVALGAEPTVGGDADPVEDHLAGGLGVPAHLSLVRTEGDPGVVAFDDEGGDAARALRAGACHDDVDLGGTRAGDELLDPGQYVAVTRVLGPGAQCGGVGSGAGLGQAVAAQGPGAAQIGEPAGPLRHVPVPVDHPGDHVVDGEVPGDGRTAGGEGLEDEDAVAAAEPGPAVLLADVDAAEPEVRRLADHVQRKVLVLVPGDGVRAELLLGEVEGDRGEGELIGGEREGHGLSPSSGW